MSRVRQFANFQEAQSTCIASGETERDKVMISSNLSACFQEERDKINYNTEMYFATSLFSIL